MGILNITMNHTEIHQKTHFGAHNIRVVLWYAQCILVNIYIMVFGRLSSYRKPFKKGAEGLCHSKVHTSRKRVGTVSLADAWQQKKKWMHCNIVLFSSPEYLEVLGWMDSPTQDDNGGGKKMGLARLAKTISLSSSLNNLQNEEGNANEKDGIYMTCLLTRFLI